jgi:hypothetical protein
MHYARSPACSPLRQSLTDILLFVPWQQCPYVGGTCSGACAGGKSFCSQGSIGDCSAIDMKVKANEEIGNNLCKGGFCSPANTGLQCPKGAFVTISNATFPQGITVDTTIENKLTFVDELGVGRLLFAVDCSGGGTCAASGMSMHT